MSEENVNVEPEIVDDSITADDTGLSSDAGGQELSEEESQEVSAEAEEGTEEETSVKAETAEELEEEVEQAIEDGATEEDVANMIKEFKIKVNGKEQTVKLDLSDEDAIKRELQMSKAGQSAMQRARELEKLYGDEIARLKENPWEVLKELDLDPDQLAEQRIREKVEELKKSPEQVEKEKMQKELEQARAELNKQKEQAERAKFEQLQQQAAAELESEIEAALDAHKDLPKTQKTVARIADALLWAETNGFEDVSVEDVLPSVKQEIRSEFNQLMDAMGEDAMEAYIGKRNLDRLRQKRLSKAKTNNIKNIEPTVKEKQASDKEKKRLRAKDYFKNL